ncbi:hypothetical protein WISP_92884 [Willisornis vidua]|uniref:Uncharacterized protein n=1 Tax=Willisornis vidua TaxID=1566151 RepID=A0ABQ9D701_9PASS|nr:hypothetical protein WISP_92884 [Willisornis vidua]
MLQDPTCVLAQILALILVRRLLDFVFSQHDLAWIDNIIPEKEKKKEDDKKKKKKGNKGDGSSDEELLQGHPDPGNSPGNNPGNSPGNNPGISPGNSPGISPIAPSGWE